MTHLTREVVTDIARVFLTSLLTEDFPKTVHEASKKVEWQEAMKTESRTTWQNQTRWSGQTLHQGEDWG